MVIESGFDILFSILNADIVFDCNIFPRGLNMIGFAFKTKGSVSCNSDYLPSTMRTQRTTSLNDIRARPNVIFT